MHPVFIEHILHARGLHCTDTKINMKRSQSNEERKVGKQIYIYYMYIYYECLNSDIKLFYLNIHLN